MRSTDIVTATVEVAVDPATAFAIFTEEIGRWWRPGPINWNNSERATGIRIEPGVGGRWLEAAVFRGEPEEGLATEGPCVFELPEATLVLPPGWRARVDRYGTIEATRSK